jgi:PAS domain S-box-containing protein
MAVGALRDKMAEPDTRQGVAEALPFQREHLYRLIAENMNDAIWLMDLNFKFLYISPSMARARGSTLEELAALPIEKHMTQASLDLVRRAVREELDPEKLMNPGVEKSRLLELEIYRKDGSTYVSEIRVTLLRDDNGRPTGLLGVGRDITDKKKIESALLDSEDRYRRIANTLTDYLYTVTFENGKPVKTLHGPGCFMVTGYTNEEFQKNSQLWIQMVHPDDRQSVRNFIHQIMAKPLTIPIEHRIVRKDRVERWVRNTPVFHFDARGTMLSYDGIVQDITERKQAEDSVRLSEQRYRTLFSGIQDVVAVSEMLPDGRPGRFVEVNNVLCDLVGYTRDELLTMTALDITEEEQKNELRRTSERRLNGENVTFQRRFVAKDGKKVPVEVSNQVVYLGEKPHILAIARDMTERNRVEEEIQKAQHLESLSVLASGIAHDFNNLLGGIFGYIDIAREYSATPKKSREFLEKALRSLDRAKDLSQRLLMFSKGSAPVKKVVDVEGLIREAAALSLAGKNVKAKVSVADDLYSCECDPTQIGRVLSNLIVNAHQAMPDGGTVHVAAENADACGPLQEPGGAPGPYVKISVRDTGTGIPGDKIEKIFDPFFTTKKTGTGLGLTISQSIIGKHGGMIDVSSEVGKGTEFHVFLPASTQKAEQSADNKPPKAVAGAGIGHGRILLMDDEDFVLDIASRMLLKMGFSPQTSQHGEEACDLYRKAIDEERPFCAVILDLTIPAGMGGVRTMMRLLEMDPAVKAIASSGYSDDPVLAEPAKYGFSAVLKKPYMAGELQEVLHAVLAKSGSFFHSDADMKNVVHANKTKRKRN